MTSDLEYKYQLGILIIFHAEENVKISPIIEYYKNRKQIYL